MIQSVLTFTLTGRNDQLDPSLDFFQTVFLQGQTITAAIALSAVSQGIDLDRRQSGFAGSFITKAGIVVGPRRTDNLNLDPRDVTRTQIRIVNCSFVTFRMVLSLAQAFATATVFVEGAAALQGMKTASAYISEAASGKIKGLHRIAYPAEGPAPSEALILRRVRACAAAAWSVNIRTLNVARAHDSDPALSSALILEKKTGRIRVSNTARSDRLHLPASIEAHFQST